MKKQLLFVTLFLSALRFCSFANNPDSIICDSVAIKTFHVLIASSINIILVNSNLKYAYIKGTASSISSVQIRQAGDILYVSRKGISLHKGKVFVYIPIKSLRNIEAKDGAQVSSYDQIGGDTLLLSAYDQSSITIMTEANLVRTSSGKNGAVELIEISDYSFNQRDENGVSFIEFRRKNYSENFLNTTEAKSH